MIATFQQIADSLGISKQAVDKQFVRKQYLVKNKHGKIDIDDPGNRDFLESKGADFSVFGVSNIQKVIQKPDKMPEKPVKTQDNIPQKKTITERIKEDPRLQLDFKLKMENIKAKQLESEIKKIKIEEQNGRLVSRSLAEKLINDSLGSIVQSFLTIPSSVIDMIFTIYNNHPEDRRERAEHLLIEKYTKEAKKIISRAQTQFRKNMKEQQEAEKDEE